MPQDRPYDGARLFGPDGRIVGDEYATSPLYDEKERAALEYADRMTITDQDVDD